MHFGLPTDRKPIRLGPDRLHVFLGDKDKTKIKQFVNTYVTSFPLLVLASDK